MIIDYFLASIFTYTDLHSRIMQVSCMLDQRMYMLTYESGSNFHPREGDSRMYLVQYNFLHSDKKDYKQLHVN